MCGSISSSVGCFGGYGGTVLVGGGGYVHTFPVVSSRGSVHPSYGSQFPPVAAEVSKWRWDVGSLVHVVGPVLGYF